MTDLFDSNGNREFFDDYEIHLGLHIKMTKRLEHLSLENAKIVADEYQHNWLVCHELRFYG